MINFPIFKNLSITNFGLYPGDEFGEPGLHINFKKGLTLILGANGLGKTTLINILYRLLTGAYDIPGLAGRPKLGNLALEARGLSYSEKSLFSNRVVDGAAQARAKLIVQIGEHELVIERSLQNLLLTHFQIDGIDSGTHELNNFQLEILRLTGVSSFGDWVLLLRHLVFYFEDRRALVWDSSAQKEILRILFLSIEVSIKWLTDSREIVALDSRMRNLRAVANREENALSQSEAKTEGGAATLQQLRALEDVQRVDQETLQRLNDEFINIDADRQNQRLRLLTTEQERETASRAVERLKLTEITASFPKMSETMRFILSHLLTESECLVCGNHVPQVAQEYLEKLSSHRCLICDTQLKEEASSNVDVKATLQQSVLALQQSELAMIEARRHYESFESQYQKYLGDTSKLEASIRSRSSQINKIIKDLPEEEGELRRLRAEINQFQSQVYKLTESLDEKKGKYRAFIEKSSRDILSRSSQIKETFDRYAAGFLLEQCELIWSPQKLKVGEYGEAIDFPAFDLNMSGTNFESAVRRTGPEQVSESQREFIDLAFRMAMMEVAGAQIGSSLVIDAPESSLDAVFVTRAADVLTRFANKYEAANRLIITSNLVEGRLIPDLISKSTEGDDVNSCIVNLLDIAAPTAAVRELKPQYDRVLEELLTSAKSLKIS